MEASAFLPPYEDKQPKASARLVPGPRNVDSIARHLAPGHREQRKGPELFLVLTPEASNAQFSGLAIARVVFSVGLLLPTVMHLILVLTCPHWPG